MYIFYIIVLITIQYMLHMAMISDVSACSISSNTVSNRARTVLPPGPDTFPKTNGPDMKSGDYGLLSAFLKRSCYESFSDPLRSCVFGRVESR